MHELFEVFGEKIFAVNYFGHVRSLSVCLATQDWVKTYVPEQLFPVNKRISDTEANVTQLGERCPMWKARSKRCPSRSRILTAG